MITQYNNILSSIIKSEGGVITIIKDYNRNNNDFLLVLKNDLMKKYNIIDNVSYDKLDKYINITTEKTIFFVDATNISTQNIKINNINSHNITIILIVKYHDTYNTNLPIGNYRILYLSNLVITLIDDKVKTIKDRYGNLSTINPININNFISKIRKLKLIKISKEIL